MRSLQQPAAHAQKADLQRNELELRPATLSGRKVEECLDLEGGRSREISCGFRASRSPRSLLRIIRFKHCHTSFICRCRDLSLTLQRGSDRADEVGERGIAAKCRQRCQSGMVWTARAVPLYGSRALRGRANRDGDSAAICLFARPAATSFMTCLSRSVSSW